MYRQTLKAVLISGSSVCALALIPVVKAQEISNEEGTSKKCRASDLPLYPPAKSLVTKVKKAEPSELENMLIKPVSFVRENLCFAVNESKSAMNKISTSTKEFSENFNFIVAYLREEDNEAQRIGAVAMGTITGFIFGLRGGIIKKVIYSAAGTGIMGAICFPEETNVYVKQGVEQGKLLTKIAYNFIYGVKPGDPQPDLNFPELHIPTSLQEIADLTKNIGSSTLNAILPPKSKDEKASESKNK